MSAADDIRAEIERERLVAIVRRANAAAAVEAARELVAGGVRVMEFSLAVPSALEAIATAAGELGDGALVGAGTVLDVEQAEAAVDAGARYLVAPGFDPAVLAWAESAGVLHIPGAFSPTEVLNAHRAGASLIKLFPAGRLGPAYVKDLLAPVPSLELVPTGAIDEGNARAFLEAGAAAVAIGSSLVPATSSSGEVADRARRFKTLTSAVDTREGGDDER